MVQAASRIKAVGEIDGDPVFGAEPAETAPQSNGEAVKILLLLLKTASQKTLIAMSNLVTLIGLGTGFWLWLTTMPGATPTQLVGLGLYGAFVVSVRFVWRK